MSRNVKGSVFLLQHVNVDSDGGEDVKTIGIFSTREAAEAAIDQAKKLPGFRAAPDGFSIDEYAIDTPEWREGFGIPDDCD